MLGGPVEVRGGNGESGGNIISIVGDRVVIYIIIILIHPEVIEDIFTASMTITT